MTGFGFVENVAHLNKHQVSRLKTLLAVAKVRPLSQEEQQELNSLHREYMREKATNYRYKWLRK